MSLKKSLIASAAAFALGGASVGTLITASQAQDAKTPPVAAAQEGPTEARPDLMAPDTSFIQQLSFADLVEEVAPAVVSIQTEVSFELARSGAFPPELERMLPEEFRRRFEDDMPSERRSTGQGSGFFIDDQGHIVTNNHVVDSADRITVILNNGDELEATLVGTDPATDLAVLKVDPSAEQRYVRFAQEANLRVGDYVLAVGNPFGLGGSVTSGIVSAIGREDDTRRTQYANFIQIDASINRGNSGGPTFDLRGNVVGVNTAIISPTGGNVGIGLAIPADVATDVVGQLINSGVVTRGWLGVGINDLDELLASAVGLEEPTGALVQSVQPDSPAAAAGFKEGDVVLEFDRQPIASASALTRTVGALPPGKTVKAVVFRDNARTELEVTLAKKDPFEAREARDGDASPEAPVEPEVHQMSMDLGVTFGPLNARNRRTLGIEEETQGVLVIDVDATSEAFDAGIREDMVITRVANTPVATPEELERAVKDAAERGQEAVLVRVVAARQPAVFLALPVPDAAEAESGETGGEG